MNRPINRMLGLLAVLAVATTASAASRQVTETGNVTEVTLYRGEAQVVREVPVGGAAGPIELVVTDLPMQLQPASMFGEGGEGLEVRAVRYRPKAVGEVPDEKIAALDKQIVAVQDDLALVEQKRQLLNKRASYLDNLEKFVTTTAGADLNKGVLDAAALEKLTTMSFERREQIAEVEIELRKEERELREQLNLLQRQRNQLTSGARKTVHEAVLFLDKAAAGDATVRLTYLVRNCGWSPAYNFRADSAAENVEIEYNALVQQMSGEDWTGVKLTLSTATPQLSAAAPGVAPFRVVLASGELDSRTDQTAAQARDRYSSVRRELKQAEAAQNANFALDANIDASWRMNAGANEMQLLELKSDFDDIRGWANDTSAADDGPSLSYQLKTPVSLASRNDQQMIRIIGRTLPGEFYRTATPVLSRHVYRQADVKNTTDLDLLGGQVSMYLDGRFVGRMEIPTVARGQTVVIGLGADPQLSAARQLVERTETTQGGNQVVTFDYRLTIENYHGQPVNVRVFDRVPYADDSKDLRVTLGEMSDELSDDPLYLRLDRPKGILRWDIEVPANASGADARQVTFSYMLEYARQYHLANPASVPGQAGGKMAPADEFDQLQRDRLRY